MLYCCLIVLGIPAVCFWLHIAHILQGDVYCIIHSESFHLCMWFKILAQTYMEPYALTEQPNPKSLLPTPAPFGHGVMDVTADTGNASGSVCTSAGILVNQGTQTEPIKSLQHIQSKGSITEQPRLVVCGVQCVVPDHVISTPKHSSPKMEFVSPATYTITDVSTSSVEDDSGDVYSPGQMSASSCSSDEEPTQTSFYMVSSSSLKKLMVHGPKCGGLVLERLDSHHGIMLRSKMTCEHHCEVTWESQPIVGQRQSLGKKLLEYWHKEFNFPSLCSYYSPVALRCLSLIVH